MAEASSPQDLKEAFGLASDAIERRLLAAGLPFQAADAEVLKRLTGEPKRSGWVIQLDRDYLGKERKLYLSLPPRFPIDPPAAYVLPHAYQEWPHAEPSGRLCLWQAEHRAIGDAVDAVIDDFFERIGKIIELSYQPANSEVRQKEFASEWLSYWCPHEATGKRLRLCNLVTAPATAITPLYDRCLIRAGTPRDRTGRAKMPANAWASVTLLGSSLEMLQMWGADFLDVKRLPDAPTGIFIPIETLVSPRMPTTLAELKGWLSVCGGNLAVMALSDAIAQALAGSKSLFVIFGLPTDNGVALNGLMLEARVRYPKPSADQHWNAATKRAAEAAALANPIWVINPLSVARADTEWMRDRCVDQGANALAGQHVVLIGCGMLGSPIAEGLARSGVGRMTLIDNDRLDPANIGRHVLGASYIGQPKASALAHHLRSCIPTLDVTAVDEDVVTQQRSEIFKDDVDLVICSAANWRSEYFALKERQRLGAKTKIIVCWVEPFAAAGHALFTTSASDDVLSLFEADGRFREPCSDWPNQSPVKQMPACQATFQPAGMVACVPIIAMCSALAIETLLGRRDSSRHCFWVGDVSSIEAAGGRLTDFANRYAQRAMHELPLSS